MNFLLQCCVLFLLAFTASTRAFPTNEVILPDDGQLIEGDIVVSHGLKDYVQATAERKRDIHENIFVWIKIGNTVKIPYTVKGLSTQIRHTLELAFQAFKGQTCVEFVPHNGQSDYIEFTSGDRCASPVGRQGGAQRVYLGSGCGKIATVLHEIMHSLGFLHEHTREDRDQFVNVRLENVKPGSESQFQKYSLQSYGEPYDKASLMQYRVTEFTKNGKNTIESKSDPDEKLGNDNYMSKTDVKQINKIYNCPSRFLALDDYTITIYTSNKWFAGTDATVFLEMKGNGEDHSGEFIAGTGFDGGSTKSVTLFFPHMVVKRLIVRHDNKGYLPGWNLDKIVIADRTTGKTVTLQCDCWIDYNAMTLAV